MLKQTSEHKIHHQANTLYQKANDGLFTDDDQHKLHQLDKQLTEIVLASKTRCSHKKINRDPWSPQLKQKGKATIYWHTKLASLHHLNAHDNSHTTLQHAAGIPDNDHINICTPQECKQQLNHAWQEWHHT